MKKLNGKRNKNPYLLRTMEEERYERSLYEKEKKFLHDENLDILLNTNRKK